MADTSLSSDETPPFAPGWLTGVDLGGTKIEAAVLDPSGALRARLRRPTPRAYEAVVAEVAALVAEAEARAGAAAPRVGVGGPGSVSPRTGLMRNANSTALNGRALPEDLAAALGRPVIYANDADCLAASEAADGAGAGAQVVFAAILGTGVGGGLALNGRAWNGVNRMAGEWGHTPLPWPTDHEAAVARPCWCGRTGCIEAWLSGPAFEADHAARTGETLSASEIGHRAAAADPEAAASLERYIDRLGRGLAGVVDLLDPEVIVLGGGVSNLDALYERLPAAIAPHLFGDAFSTPIRKAGHGDSSGVRGAAWLGR